MNRKFAIATTLLAGSLAFASTANASDSILGAIVGGGAGVLVGQAVGGRDGAIVGGALGAITGAVIADNDDDYRGRRGAYVGSRPVFAGSPRAAYYERPTEVVPARGAYYAGRDWYAERRSEYRHRHHGDGHWDRDRHDRWDRRD